ncbi:transcriptional repressor [Candidatus Parcubacteria bacterium]|nr:transcriptional repressor [Candidatus Parcubacteria bacterium]
MEKATKTIEKILEDNNLKNTKGHFNVLSVLIKEKHPLSVENVGKKISIKINTTTLYRILDKLSKKGIIYQTTFLDGKTYYEYQKHHHHHITCTKCGIKNKVDFCVSKEIEKINIKKAGFVEINDHVLEFFGVCKKCQKK